MEHLLLKDKRRQIRHPLTGDLTGSMIAAASGSLIPCIATEVSESGLRVVLALDFAAGTELLLRLGGQETRLRVVWCTKDTSFRKGYFACGLAALDATVNLLQIFTGAGWLG